MTTYRVIYRTTGGMVYEYTADAPVEWAGMEFATHDHVAQPDETVVAPVYSGSWRITKLAFRNRFTAQEKAGIEIASLDVPTAPMAQRGLAASLRANQLDIQAASYIDLMRPDTRAGVAALEQYGMIQPGRATVILDSQPTDEEMYHG